MPLNFVRSVVPLQSSSQACWTFFVDSTQFLMSFSLLKIRWSLATSLERYQKALIQSHSQQYPFLILWDILGAEMHHFEILLIRCKPFMAFGRYLHYRHLYHHNLDAFGRVTNWIWKRGFRILIFQTGNKWKILNGPRTRKAINRSKLSWMVSSPSFLSLSLPCTVVIREVSKGKHGMAQIQDKSRGFSLTVFNFLALRNLQMPCKSIFR